MQKLKSVEETIIAIGALDIGYIGWIAINSITSEVGQLTTLWESLIAFGLPYPELQFGFILAFYASILVCGLSLALCYKKLAWLNYV